MAKTKITPDAIDKKKFETLVKLGLSNEELIEFFMINSSQLWSWIKQVYETRKPFVVLKKIRVEGKIEFLSSQRLLAMKDHVVSIWVGKNYYNQKDGKEEVEANDIEDLTPLVKLLKDDEEENNGNSNN